MAGNSLTVTETGLQGVETAMQAVSDNLANAQTTGFHSESADFATLLGEFVAGNALGGGVTTTGITRDLSEGAITQTNSPTDMAIQGDGYFVLGGSSGALSYTRDGQTQVAANGTLVGFNGDSVMGYSVNAAGLSSGVLGPIIDSARSAGTDRFDQNLRPNGNLNAASPVIAGAINPANPATYSTSVSVQVYDSLGNSHVLTYYYQNAGPGVAPVAENWNWTATLDGSAVGLANNSGTRRLRRDGRDGQRRSARAATDCAVAGAANLSLTAQLLRPDPIRRRHRGHRQRRRQCGRTPARRADRQQRHRLDFLLQWANRQRRPGRDRHFSLGTKPPARQWGLLAPPASSGAATISTAGSGAAGSIQANALESSNVDTTSQLVNLVVLQRNYQANAKALQTEDSILGTIIGIQTQ